MTMKALVLAAGLGARLLPHTKLRPKPLFPLNGTPFLQLSIEQLIQAGCTEIIVNTHHLHEQIELFIRDTCFPVPVSTIHEPEILDTGGAIKNVRSFMGNEPFFVVNSDIVSNIDLKKVWEFHLSGNYPATLVLHDEPRFNKVMVNDALFVEKFIKDSIPPTKNRADEKEKEHLLAFTGVQVLSSEIFDHMPESRCFGSIPVYAELAARGNMVKAYVCEDIFWQDIGTPESYVELSIRHAAAKVFAGSSHSKEDAWIKEEAFTIGNDSTLQSPCIDFSGIKKISITPLAGDGSDRHWFRCLNNNNKALHNDSSCSMDCSSATSTGNHDKEHDSHTWSLIAAAHGIHSEPKDNGNDHNCGAISEIDSFVKIGAHLTARGIPVPQIRSVDRFSGIVLLEDLGDIHLQQIINNMDPEALKKEISGYPKEKCETSKENTWNRRRAVQWYRDLCDLAIRFSMDGIRDFHDTWTFQTTSYSKSMILEKECRYFMDAFVSQYLNQRQTEQKNSRPQDHNSRPQDHNSRPQDHNSRLQDHNSRSQDLTFESFLPCFEFIADQALENAFQGLMHRDMQSRNIMVRDGQCFFIDFQSARKGPLQYDLASLLIDPYVNLDEELRDTVIDYCAEEVCRLTGFDKKKFINGYRYSAVTRNLQMLGAFSHLTMNRGKRYFEQYIPSALDTLKNNLEYIDTNRISNFYQFIRSLEL